MVFVFDREVRECHFFFHLSLLCHSNYNVISLAHTVQEKKKQLSIRTLCYDNARTQIRDMSLGLLRGTVSLFRNLIFVLTDVVSKITLGATRGLDPIIMYVDEYTSFRPRDGLLQGIATGISEAVTTPTRSVSDRGLVRGLVRGVRARSARISIFFLFSRLCMSLK